MKGRLSNLTPEAIVDPRRELGRSRRKFGDVQALRLQDGLLRRFREIADGAAPGHRHGFAGGTRTDVLCVTVGPLLVFYGARTRAVLRVVDGRRDLSRLFDDP